MRLYFDTSVLGAITDREEPRRVAVTRTLLWSVADGVHEGVISNVVEEELEQAPEALRRKILAEIAKIEFELAVEDEESRRLFEEYRGLSVVPPRYRNDLRHVAVATVANVEALVSWNSAIW